MAKHVRRQDSIDALAHRAAPFFARLVAKGISSDLLEVLMRDEGTIELLARCLAEQSRVQLTPPRCSQTFKMELDLKTPLDTVLDRAACPVVDTRFRQPQIYRIPDPMEPPATSMYGLLPCHLEVSGTFALLLLQVLGYAPTTLRELAHFAAKDQVLNGRTHVMATTPMTLVVHGPRSQFTRETLPTYEVRSKGRSRALKTRDFGRITSGYFLVRLPEGKSESMEDST